MPWLIAGVAAATAVGIAILWCAWWLWWRLPKWQLDALKLTVYDPKARADVEDNFRKTVGQILVGIGAVLIGSAFTYYQFWQQQQHSSQQEKASHEAKMGDQFVKGLELLGIKQVITRAGGVYLMGEVMNTSEQYHRPVLEALCAFVRDVSRTANGEGPPATDIQAALTVIGRRAAIRPVLPRIRYPDVVATAGMSAAIDYDIINMACVHIPKSDLSGTNFRNADFTDANLSGADLSGAAFNGADLAGADLSGANLSNATSANLPMFVPGTDLTGAWLFSANLSGASLSGADLTRAGVEKALLVQSDLTHATLVDADLAHANLSKAKLDDANLGGAIVSQPQLDEACGTNVTLDPGLTIKPCPASPP
jgi:hypothetical protein